MKNPTLDRQRNKVTEGKSIQKQRYDSFTKLDSPPTNWLSSVLCFITLNTISAYTRGAQYNFGNCKLFVDIEHYQQRKHAISMQISGNFNNKLQSVLVKKITLPIA